MGRQAGDIPVEVAKMQDAEPEGVFGQTAGWRWEGEIASRQNAPDRGDGRVADEEVQVSLLLAVGIGQAAHQV
jgi:hypothetical protein